MSAFRTWADVLAAASPPPDHGMRPMGAGGRIAGPMTESLGPLKAGPTIDRHGGDGPPPCCPGRHISADVLVWYGGIGTDALARVRSVLPALTGIADEDLYLCDGCRGRVVRARVLSPEEMPRAWPMEGGDVST